MQTAQKYLNGKVRELQRPKRKSEIASQFSAFMIHLFQRPWAFSAVG
jgi:hypothetical protein